MITIKNTDFNEYTHTQTIDIEIVDQYKVYCVLQMSFDKALILKQLYNTQYLHPLYELLQTKQVKSQLNTTTNELMLQPLQSNAQTQLLNQFFDKLLQYVIDHKYSGYINDIIYDIEQAYFYMMNVPESTKVINKETIISLSTIKSQKAHMNRVKYHKPQVFGKRTLNITGLFRHQQIVKFFEQNTDNRVNVMLWLFKQLHTYKPNKSLDMTKYIRILSNRQLEPVSKLFNSFLTQYGYEIKNVINQSNCVQIINSMRLTMQFFKYLQKDTDLNREKPKPNRYIYNTLMDSDEMYLTRIVKYLYQKIYGGHIDKSIQIRSQFYATLQSGQVSVLVKQLEIFLQQLNQKNCEHINIKNIPLITNFCLITSKTYKPMETDVMIHLKDNDVIAEVPINFLKCMKCKSDVICGHKVIELIFGHDNVYVSDLMKHFQIVDSQYDQFNYCCKVCGQLLSEIPSFLQREYGRLKDKKYTMHFQIFNKMMQFVTSRFQISRYHLYDIFNDFIGQQYNNMKSLYQQYKVQSNYNDHKKEILYLFTFAYFTSFDGNNISFDSKACFKYIMFAKKQKFIAEVDVDNLPEPIDEPENIKHETTLVEPIVESIVPVQAVVKDKSKEAFASKLQKIIGILESKTQSKESQSEQQKEPSDSQAMTVKMNKWTYDEYIRRSYSIRKQFKIISLLSNIGQSSLEVMIQNIMKRPFISDLIGTRLIGDLYKTHEKRQSTDIIIDLMQLYTMPSNIQLMNTQKYDDVVLAQSMKMMPQFNQLLIYTALQLNKIPEQSLVAFYQMKKDKMYNSRVTTLRESYIMKSDKFTYGSDQVLYVVKKPSISYEMQFYKIYCFKTKKNKSNILKQHFVVDDMCRYCDNKKPDTSTYHKSFNEMFVVDIKKHNLYKKQNNHEINILLNKMYSEKVITNYAIKLDILPIALLNLFGFDYIEYDTITHLKHKSDTFEQIIKIQIDKYNVLKQNEIHNQQHNSLIITNDDLKWLNTIKFNWYLYNQRFNKIQQHLLNYIKQLGIQPQILTLMKQFNKFVKHIKRIPGINQLLLCQCLIAQFIQYFIPELITIYTQPTIEAALKDLIARDKRTSIQNVFVGVIAQRFNKAIVLEEPEFEVIKNPVYVDDEEDEEMHHDMDDDQTKLRDD